MFENTYCNCTEKYDTPAWCGKYITGIKKPFCVLNGGLGSKFCPDAMRLEIDGTTVGDYISSDLHVCNKSIRKFSVVTYTSY